MKLSELRPRKRYTRKKRKGRGAGSGRGKTSGRGMKGQMSRSGSRIKPGFEGGQMPLIRRIPKRGFSNVYNLRFNILNVGVLNKFKKDATITPQVLKDKKMVKDLRFPIKILGGGEVKHSITVEAHAFSKPAKDKIEKAGGKAEIIPNK